MTSFPLLFSDRAGSPDSRGRGRRDDAGSGLHSQRRTGRERKLSLSLSRKRRKSGIWRCEYSQFGSGVIGTMRARPGSGAAAHASCCGTSRLAETLPETEIHVNRNESFYFIDQGVESKKELLRQRGNRAGGAELSEGQWMFRLLLPWPGAGPCGRPGLSGHCAPWWRQGYGTSASGRRHNRKGTCIPPR